MGVLVTTFDEADIQTLIEAMGDWELVNNQDYVEMQIVEKVPMPPEENAEARQYIAAIKQHFSERKKEIENTRANRQERAVFLKAKLMLVRRDLTIKKVFEMATDDDQARKDKLALAEEFIQDLGVQKHWEDFLAQKQASGA